jgi:hypothetical protein
MGPLGSVAWERAMKIQEVILQALAKRITWWPAAEISGISDRLPAAGATGDHAASLGVVHGDVFRFQRAPLPREAARAKWHSVQQKAEILALQPQAPSKSLTYVMEVS